MYRKALKTIQVMEGGASKSKTKKMDDQLLHFNSNLYDITESFYKTYADISGNAMKKHHDVMEGGKVKETKHTGGDDLKEYVEKLEEDFRKRIEKLEEEFVELKEYCRSELRSKSVGGESTAEPSETVETEPEHEQETESPETDSDNDDLKNIEEITKITDEDMQNKAADAEEDSDEEETENETEEDSDDDESEDDSDDDESDVETDLNNLGSMEGGCDLDSMLSKLGNKYAESFKTKSALKGGNYGESKEMNKSFPY